MSLALALAAGCEHGAPPVAGAAAAGPARELRVGFVGAGFPGADPSAAAWERAREAVVPLLPQDVTEPRLTAGERGVESLRLRALHDGARIAFRLEWEDASPDGLVDLGGATDACAIELPATGAGGPLPDSMMGEAGKPVAIVLWRFASQRRADGEPHGVAALYPNAAIDHYPFEAARDEAARAEMERRYAHARAAGNATVLARGRSATEDLVCEGFGNLASAPEQVSQGRGARVPASEGGARASGSGGRWRVAIARPLDLAPGARTALRPGASTFVAVAVWDGARGHVGAKKMRSIWVPVEVEEAKP